MCEIHQDRTHLATDESHNFEIVEVNYIHVVPSSLAFKLYATSRNFRGGRESTKIKKTISLDNTSVVYIKKNEPKTE